MRTKKLKSKKVTVAPEAPVEAFMNMPQVCNALHCSVSSVRRMIAREQLHPFQAAGKYGTLLFRLSDVCGIGAAKEKGR